MTKEELLKRLHEILEIVGPDRAFEISENTNERKTLWIHQTPGEDEYLMLSATKLFPISTIRNIVYEYGEDITVPVLPQNYGFYHRQGFKKSVSSLFSAAVYSRR